ncbi:MAG: hypothetical protein ACJ8F1_15940 [Polyangia bacterium]
MKLAAPILAVALCSLGSLAGCRRSEAAGAPADKAPRSMQVVSVDASGPPVAGDICYQSGLCWDRPRPQGEQLNAVWAANANDVWAVGDGGTALHFDGASWRRVPTGTGATLVGVWGGSPKSVWMLGEQGQLLHWEGERILRVDDPLTLHASPPAEDLADDMAATYAGLWGDGHQLWMVGGARHKRQSPGDLRGGEVAIVRQFTGGRWHADVIKGAPPLEAIWGRTANDIWAVGRDLSRDPSAQSRALHYDGHAWSAAPAIPAAWLAAGPAHFRTVTAFDTGINPVGPLWKAKSGPVWILQGDAVARLATVPAVAAQPAEGDRLFKGVGPVRDLFGTDDGQVWVVGARGTLRRFDGQAWAGRVPGGRDEPLYDLRGVAAFGDEVWAVGQGGILRRRAGRWSSVPAGAETDFFGVWGASADDVWVVGNFGVIVRCLKGTCHEIRPARRTNPVQAPLYAVAGLGPNDVWAVGYKGAGVHWDGKTWTEQPLPTTKAASHLYAGDGELWLFDQRWDGHQWAQGELGPVRTGRRINAVVPDGHGEHWVLTSDGAFHLSNGVAEPVAHTAALGVACAAGPGTLWLLGSNRQVRIDGSRATTYQEVAPASASAEAAMGDGTLTACAYADGNLWVTGRGGRVLRKAGGAKPGKE